MEMFVVLAAAAAMAIGVAAAWRELAVARRELPLHVALRRFETELRAEALKRAEARCRSCRIKKRCMRGLVRYEDLPAECPNGPLFSRNFAPDQAAGAGGA